MVSTGPSTTISSLNGLGAVCKKVPTLDNDGKESIRSLAGLQCDADVAFVPKAHRGAPAFSGLATGSYSLPEGRFNTGQPLAGYQKTGPGRTPGLPV
ncbi:hypothetical protein HPB52_024539 [Rhipicephalus sanguineus]|uniref:Uncharacterized protein n=1 Tax=Rhipicephalus sanguineus TaxID=34632 RepID=A0A9D4SMP3_RHISA|nr:hypothetical protein HPB52_024539 [Rhipicephalus sanguineus]